MRVHLKLKAGEIIGKIIPMRVVFTMGVQQPISLREQ